MNKPTAIATVIWQKDFTPAAGYGVTVYDWKYGHRTHVLTAFFDTLESAITCAKGLADLRYISEITR